MGKNYLELLIQKYFDHNLPSEDVQVLFKAWLLENEHRKEKDRMMQEIWDNDLSMADVSTLAELKDLHVRIRLHAPRKKNWFKQITVAAAILVLPLLGAAATYYTITANTPVKISKSELVEHFTHQGERRRIILSDGSEVWLNAGSVLICSQYFEEDRRTLFLSGEANFKVTKDPNRPFTVKTTYVDVVALGTTFNVQAYHDLENTTTSLEEGSVQVKTKDGRQSIIIEPNERAIYNHQTNLMSKSSIDAGRNAYWKDGYMVFQAASFSHMVKTIERRFNVRIHYEAKKYEDRSYTVRFNPDENLSQVLDILKEMIPNLQYRIKDYSVYIK